MNVGAVFQGQRPGRLPSPTRSGHRLLATADPINFVIGVNGLWIGLSSGYFGVVIRLSSRFQLIEQFGDAVGKFRRQVSRL